MTQITDLRTKLLDGKELFHLYWEMGSTRSYRTVRNRVTTEQGLMNERTGKPITTMAVWFSLWSWAIDPSQCNEVMEVMNKALLNQGRHLNKEEMFEFLKPKAYQCFKAKKDPRRYENWLNQWKSENLTKE